MRDDRKGGERKRERERERKSIITVLGGVIIAYIYYLRNLSITSPSRGGIFIQQVLSEATHIHTHTHFYKLFNLSLSAKAKFLTYVYMYIMYMYTHILQFMCI